jgi:hypothetical protein
LSGLAKPIAFDPTLMGFAISTHPTTLELAQKYRRFGGGQ